MTSVTETYGNRELATFRAVVWMETFALSVLLWMAILQVIARIAP